MAAHAVRLVVLPSVAESPLGNSNLFASLTFITTAPHERMEDDDQTMLFHLLAAHPFDVLALERFALPRLTRVAAEHAKQQIDAIRDLMDSPPQSHPRPRDCHLRWKVGQLLSILASGVSGVVMGWEAIEPEGGSRPFCRR